MCRVLVLWTNGGLIIHHWSGLVGKFVRILCCDALVCAGSPITFVCSISVIADCVLLSEFVIELITVGFSTFSSVWWCDFGQVDGIVRTGFCVWKFASERATPHGDSGLVSEADISDSLGAGHQLIPTTTQRAFLLHPIHRFLTQSGWDFLIIESKGMNTTLCRLFFIGF